MDTKGTSAAKAIKLTALEILRDDQSQTILLKPNSAAKVNERRSTVALATKGTRHSTGH